MQRVLKNSNSSIKKGGLEMSVNIDSKRASGFTIREEAIISGITVKQRIEEIRELEDCRRYFQVVKDLMKEAK